MEGSADTGAAAWVAAVLADPSSRAARYALADWFREQGNEETATALVSHGRWQVEVDHPSRYLVWVPNTGAPVRIGTFPNSRGCDNPVCTGYDLYNGQRRVRLSLTAMIFAPGIGWVCFKNAIPGPNTGFCLKPDRKIWGALRAAWAAERADRQ